MRHRVPDVAALVDTSQTGSLTATTVLSGADLLRRSSPHLASCALYDDELCFGVVAAWTNASRSSAAMYLRPLQLQPARRDVIATNSPR